MSDPGGPSLDWDSIFQRARHHIVRRVLLVGGIAALAALVLFSGGTASWQLTRAPDSNPPKHPKKHHEKKHHHKEGKGHHKKHHHESNHHHKPQPKPKPKPQPHPKPPPDCKGESAAAQEYCETHTASTASDLVEETPTSGGA